MNKQKAFEELIRNVESISIQGTGTFAKAKWCNLEGVKIQIRKALEEIK